MRLLKDSLLGNRSRHDGRPIYLSSAEERANVVTHGIGFGLSLLAIPLFIYRTSGSDLGLRVTCLIFVSSMTIVYLCSTLSHAYRDPETRNRLRAWDQGTIYLLIVGTYSPFIWQGSEGWYRAVFLAVVWFVALYGFAAKVIARHRINAISVVTYLALGWIPAALLIKSTPHICLVWMLLGGLSYTLGLVFLLLSRYVKYSHPVWHVMVILGSACHCQAIWHLAGSN